MGRLLRRRDGFRGCLENREKGLVDLLDHHLVCIAWAFCK